MQTKLRPAPRSSDGLRSPTARVETPGKGKDDVWERRRQEGAGAAPGQGSVPQGLAPKFSCPRPAAPPETPRKVLPPSPGVPLLSNPFPPQKSIRSSRRWRQRHRGEEGRAEQQGRDAGSASLPRGAVINLRLPTPWGLPMNRLKGEEEVELRLITRYQPGRSACGVLDLQPLGASRSWALIAAITAKWGWGLFACFAHNLWGEVLNL